ncbi:hypothetical protein [Kitasatospora kifunensis]|uniref:Uncharacterized protein n=1 Tax=Kitasatospora kifunensis TaxID=58351 RepID=A0A7W7RBL4_KITKI|nr:hypothetical protein [Kitasatospora kifunensis]MBB4928703.1 hypothetical protein [Kitasatospora kifunensis]
MDIVLISLERRHRRAEVEPAAELAEVIDTLWAHAVPADRLEHAGGRADAERLDLVLYLRTPTTDPDAALGAAPDAMPSAERRAAQLLTRCHRASSLLNGRYLPPATESTGRTSA